MDYRARQKKLLELMSANHLDAFLTTHLPNIRYLCGFTGSAGALLLAGGRPVFFSDGRYAAQAAEEVQGASIKIRPNSALDSVAAWIAAWTTKKQTKLRSLSGKNLRLGFEAEYLSAASVARLAKVLPVRCSLRQTSMLVEQIRIIKDSDEIKSIRAAAALGSSLYASWVRKIATGVKETEAAGELEYSARRAGAEGMSFSTIVASGARSALPHGVASNSGIPGRGFVVCDFGVILAGYCSDMTRTLHIGRPSAEERRVYSAVLEAQLAAVAAVRDGVTVAEVDAAARKLLKQRGLGSYFPHSTGHGVGLEIHEAPRIAARRKETLRTGMVVTIEPGVYVPGKFGVRIEDMILVTKSGCEILTPTPKELMIL